MSGFYDDLCNMLIRPARQTYTEYDLGPPAIGSLALRQNFTFSSSQNHQIKASFYRQRNPVTSACVVYLHSFNGSRLQPLRYIPQVISKGFHFCSMDFAGCGNSGGDYVSLGYHERWDALKLLQELRDRWGVREIIIWGRSMGAVTAIKLYSLLNGQQNCEKSGEIRILALVLDSAFISLKRMVVEVGSTQINMPELLVKALFLLVGSSIEKRANFKLDQLELGQDVERIRCPAMLLASKEDTFVNCSHSEEIFGRLALKDHKQMEYIGGQHYQQRTEPVFAAILQFMERKYKLFSQHAPRQLRVSYCLKQQGTVQRPFRSLKRYQPRKQPQSPQQPQIMRPCSGGTLHSARLKQTPQQTSTPIAQKGIASDRVIPLGEWQARQFGTQKKLEGPHIKITFGTSPLPTRNCLGSKSKPNFSGKLLQIVSRARVMQPDLKAGNTTDCQIQSHCNVIADKLKKRGRAHQDQQVHFLINRQQPHTHMVRFEAPTAQTNYTSANEQAERRPQKLSMTAQQYKNIQINFLKGVVRLSPMGKRKGRAKIQHSKSMSNLNQQSRNGMAKHHSRLNLIRMTQKGA